MPDDRPRRTTPVPGLLDLDAIEDANFADAVGEDLDDDAPPPTPPAAVAADPTPPETPDAPGEPPAEPAPREPSGPSTPAAPPDEPGEAPTTTPAAPSGPPPATPSEPGLAAGPEPTLPPSDRASLRSTRGPTVPLAGEGDSGSGRERSGLPTRGGRAPGPVASPASDERDPGVDRLVADTGHPGPVAAPLGDAPEPTAEPAPPPKARPSPAAEPPALPPPPPEIVETAKTATRDRGRELVRLVVEYGKAHVPETPPRASEPDAGPPRMVGRVGQILPFLRVIPAVLAVLFVASFWLMDAPLALFGREASWGELIQVLAVSGLIGFGTNWLAITMLFQPREKRAVIPQGLIPAQRERVIYRLSTAISQELINADIIKQKIQASGVIGRYRDLALGVVKGVVEDPGFRADLKRIAQDYAHEVLGSESVRREVARLAVDKVEEQAGQGLGGMALRLYRTFAEDDFQRRVDRALDELPDAVVPLLDRIDTALDAVPAKVEAHADEVEEIATRAVLSFVEGFDVKSMIAERARKFDEGQLESLLKSTSNEQLNYIKYLGAILGVFGGFVIWEPVGALVVFVTAALLLWGLDEALVRMRRG